MQPVWEVAHVLGRLGDGIEDLGLKGWQLRTLRAIQHCRTSVMGGHIDACDACGNISISYNSCRIPPKWSQKEHDIEPSGVHPSFCPTYLTQTLCQNTSLWVFE